jgi:hypothetical protein
MYGDILAAKLKNPTLVPVTTPGIPLVRMSRRIVGAGEADISSDRRRVDDSIGMTGDWRKRGPVFELPWQTLWGYEASNLLAAGRAISVTDELWDVTRVIPPCAVTGQAAGTAAAIAAREQAAGGVDFASLDVRALQSALEQDGVVLHYEQ